MSTTAIGCDLLFTPFLLNRFERSISISILRVDFLVIIEHDLVEVLIELFWIPIWRVRRSEVFQRDLIDKQTLREVEFSIGIGLVREENVSVVFDVCEVLLEVVFR